MLVLRWHCDWRNRVSELRCSKQLRNSGAWPIAGNWVTSFGIDIIMSRCYRTAICGKSYANCNSMTKCNGHDAHRFLYQGRLHSFSSSWDFLKFPPLNLWDKARLAWTITQASRRNDWQALEQIPVVDWLTKHSGPRTTERIWLPLLKAKLGDAYQRTSAAFIWATIQRLNAARRSGLKRELFVICLAGMHDCCKPCVKS